MGESMKKNMKFKDQLLPSEKKTGEFEIMEFQGKRFSGLALNSYEGE